MPSSDGQPGQSLTTDGNKNLSWSNTDTIRTMHIQTDVGMTGVVAVGSGGAVTTGGTPANNDSSTNGAGVKFSTTATINNSSGVVGPNFSYPIWNPTVDLSFDTGTIITNNMIWVGMANTALVGAGCTSVNCIDTPTTDTKQSRWRPESHVT